MTEPFIWQMLINPAAIKQIYPATLIPVYMSGHVLARCSQFSEKATDGTGRLMVRPSCSVEYRSWPRLRPRLPGEVVKFPVEKGINTARVRDYIPGVSQ